MIKKCSLAQLITSAMSSVLIAACAAEVPPHAAPEDAAEERYVAGTRLYTEKLSQTSSLELWDQGDNGVLVSVSGHNEYDAEMEPRLKQAIEAEGSSSIVRIYRRMRPQQAEVPERLFEIDRMIAEREAAPALELKRLDGAGAKRAPEGPADEPGKVVEIAEPDLPGADESPFTWMALWFRDTFCSVAGNEFGECWLDRNPNPYIQKTGTGARHVMTANTDYQDIRFRGWGSGCQFWCSFEIAWDVRVTAGHWSQYHWLGSTRITDRRSRVDAWNTANPNGPLVQFSMTWSGSSGGNSCRAIGQGCTSNSQCCQSPGVGTLCVAGVCKNDPTPGFNCDWLGESCCHGTSTATHWCNTTADPNLRCHGGATCQR